MQEKLTRPVQGMRAVAPAARVESARSHSTTSRSLDEAVDRPHSAAKARRLRVGTPLPGIAMIDAETANDSDDIDGAAERDRLGIDTICTSAMDAMQSANSGHTGTPMALVPAAWTLWCDVLRHDPAAPDWPNRDRFVRSAMLRCCSMLCALLYVLLHLVGVHEIDADGRSTGAPSAKAAAIRLTCRSPNARWRRASTATASRCSTTTSISSPATAT